MESILDKKFVQYAISVALVTGVVLIFFTPMVGFLKKLSNFSVHIMLLYLLAGMFFFLFDQKRLVIVSLACCGTLCLYLKNASNQDLRLARVNAGPSLSVGLVDLSLAEDGYEKTIENILNINADVLSFQELTPNWLPVLNELLCKEYPYHHTMVRIDPFGIGVYSKLPILATDTFFFGHIPNLVTSVEVVDNNLPFHIIHSISEAPVNEAAYMDIEDHFREVTHYLGNLEGPVITVGNYRLPSWAPEIQEYKFNAGLKDSRRDGLPRPSRGIASFFGVPVDHIFYSEGLECTNFKVLLNENYSHLGIYGSYQLKAGRPVQ